MQTINDRKCMASWAVFKRLCDDGHKNIYEVLRDFVKATIYRNSLRTFTAASLTEQVNKDYEFDLKTAIVAYAIKELPLQRNPKTGTYECDPSAYSDDESLDVKIEEAQRANNEIIEGLFAYVAKERGQQLTVADQESLIHSLIYYLLNNSYEDSNSTLISAYILICRNDARLSTTLINILEGVVRYVGVSFDSPDNASSHWTNEMTIYLDTEILFHMAGYNGTLYKKLFDDFFELVSEVNEDSLKQRQRELINLRYFEYVVEEIDKFFARANDIINGKIALNPAVTAMKEITLGCKTESELAERKGLFLTWIKEHGITPDDKTTEFYHSSHFAYNLEDETIVDRFCKENNYKRRKLVQDSLLSLSHINVLREGVSNRSFEKLGYVLLTDNYITEKLAWMEDLKKADEKPLSTNLYFITNRLWYRLGKSFGKGLTPKVFDVISKAQIILSNKINDSVYAQYEELVERLDNHEISGEGALEVLYQLRSQVKNPEEIDSPECVEEAMLSVGEPDLQKYIEDAEYRKAKMQATEEYNKRLNQLNKEIATRNEEVNRQNEMVLRENITIKEENEKVKAENDEKRAQIEEVNQQNSALNKELVEIRKSKYDTAMELYDKNLKDYVKEQKAKTKWQLFWFVLFLAISIGLSFLVVKYETWTGWPDWVRITIVVLLNQAFPVIRAWVTKISPKVIWKVLFRKNISQFENEYRRVHPEPQL